ncbi:MAG TPA: response regulator [Thermodesulfobacteriaceae bacterium]|nr:response regulator [Thermodesulfobacteriaceae bacterium]
MKNSILVLDDEKGMCQSLTTLLLHMGYDVTASTSVKEGLGILAKKFFDIVVSDIVFPDGSGFQIMDYCHDHCPKTKVIAMTGHVSIDSAIESLRHGAYDYIIKPFEFELLHHAIKRALDHQYMEEELLLAGERYKALVEELNEGYFVLEEGRIVFANSVMAHLLQREVSGLIGTALVDLVNPDHQQNFQENLKVLQKCPGTSIIEDITLRDSRGNPRPVEMKISVSKIPHLGATVVGICRDTTEREILWGQLVKAEKLAMMGEMVAGIAHELNNKLTPILGYTEMLVEQPIDEVTARRLGTVHSAALGAKNIVESLLFFAKQEQPKRIMCDINSIVQSAAELVSASFRGSDVDLSVRLDSDVPQLMADPCQLEQVVVNIMKNAFESLNKDGWIEVRAFQENKDVVIAITDNGPGISPEVCSRMFDPFFTTKERGKGTGLGLSICHGIIKSHNGDLSVDSQPGKTVFSIRLPVDCHGCSSVPKEQKKWSCIRPGANRHRILIVDDEVQIAELLREALSEDYDARLATNVEEALEKIGLHSFDLIVSDVKMPGLDGIDFYAKLLEKAPEYCSRIIYTTGVTFDDRTQSFFKETRVPYLSKPFKIKDMMEFVNQFLASDHR